MKWIFFFFILSEAAYARKCFREKREYVEDGFKVKVSHYRSEKPGKEIIIYPPTGGTNLVDRSYAKTLCYAGLNSSIIESWADDNEIVYELSIHTRFYARAQRATDILIKSLGPIDYLGILGTSIGSIHAAIAGGRLNNVKGLFLITAGADIADMIVHSSQTAMQIAWNKRKQMFGFRDKEEYLRALRPHILLEPLRYSYQGKDTGMVLALQDDVVPTKNQLLLRDHLKPKIYIEKDGSHFWSIVKFWAFSSEEVTRFFLKSSGII